MLDKLRGRWIQQQDLSTHCKMKRNVGHMMQMLLQTKRKGW